VQFRKRRVDEDGHQYGCRAPDGKDREGNGPADKGYGFLRLRKAGRILQRAG